VPTYQYTCRECGSQVEAVQKFSDDPLTVCDSCGGRLRKVFSPVGIVFKGSGFYRTDSRNGSSSASSAAAAKGSDNGSSGNSSDKPASAGDKPAEKKSSETVSASSSSSEKVA
jgi:putative FmdB family regulatory protein